MQMYSAHSVDLADHFDEENLNKCQEIEAYHDSHMEMKLKKDMDKKLKRTNTSVQVGLLMPKAAETEIHHEMQWFEEEMRNREQLRLHQIEKEVAEAEEAKDLQEKEDKLAGLKAQWQQKVEEIHLEEGELEKVQKEFDEKLQLQLKTRMDSGSSSSSATGEVPISRSRMQEEAEKRAIKKQLQKCEDESAQEQARVQILQNIEDKAALEREIVRLQKEVGLMKQRIRGRGKSHLLNMDDERKRKIETGDGQTKVNMTLEELYAPKVAPPRPVIPKAHNYRMEEARLAKEARKLAAQEAVKEGEPTC